MLNNNEKKLQRSAESFRILKYANGNTEIQHVSARKNGMLVILSESDLAAAKICDPSEENEENKNNDNSPLQIVNCSNN